MVLSHPAVDKAITVELDCAPLFQSFIHSSEIGNLVEYDGTIIRDGATLLRIVGGWAGLDVENFCLQIENSIINQAIAYHDPHLTIDSSPIEWEQGLQEGHTLHPLHKCRYPAVGDFRTSRLHFVAVDRSLVRVQGNFDDWIAQLFVDATPNWRHANEVVFPVHELQLPKVQALFRNGRVLPHTVVARPQIALRTLSLTTPDFCIKVPVAIKITTLLRTISPVEVMLGQQLGPVLPLLEKAATQFGGSLLMTREYAAATTESEHLNCIVRESVESQAVRTGDRIIVCVTLTENIDVIWGDRPDKAAVLREYCYHFFRAVLPPLFVYGLGLAAHLQNTLVRLDPHTRAIKGFVLRDMGFFKIHRETFLATAGIDIENPKIKMFTDRVEDVYWYLSSPVFNAHLSMFVRTLYPGMAGWRIVREELEKVIPATNRVAREVWLESPNSYSKADIKFELYHRQFGVTVPNPLYHCQYQD